jgi:hypothetical protein
MTDELRSFPETMELNADGDPTDAFCAQIRCANNTMQMGLWLVHVFPIFVSALRYGRCIVTSRADNGRTVKIVLYSTGCWPSQEVLIDAVEHSLIGVRFLQSWRRGGHYEFWVPVDQAT